MQQGENAMNYNPKFYPNCPFYITESERSIVCDGIECAIKNKMVFDSEKEKLDYQKKNCLEISPEGCQLYCLLCEKYATSD